MERDYTITLSQNPNPNPTPKWFSPETGVYSSMHAPRELPHDPFLDVVSFIFSHDHHGSTALVDSASGRSLSYSDLRRTVAATAAGLHRMGVTAHHTVLILLPNTIFYPVVFLAVLSVGAVVSTMNPLSSSDEIKKRIGQCRPVLAVVAQENGAKLDGFPVRVVVVPENDDGSCPLFSADPADAPRPAVKQSDAAAVLFSSGTSGESKGVVLTHGNMIAMVELFVRFEASQYPRESWRDVYLAALPMFHVYGLSLFAAGLLSLGTTVVVMRKFDAGEAVKVIERYGVTHFPAVPPALAALCRAKTTSGRALPSLLQVSSGAAPLGKNILQMFLKTFPTVDLIQGYGMTESTAVGARGFNTQNLKKHSSAGLLAPNMQAKIVDCTTGLCLPPGSSGELWLRGPGIMKGYLDDERATSLAVDKDGWLRTGDIAYFDQDAYLYIVDRLKDTIKYKGFQIAPADLEAILITHPEVLDVTVTALEDEEVGEIPVAFIVKVLGSELTSKAVIEFVAKQVAPYKKVRKVVFVNSIPRSPAGKILRRLLRNNLGVARL